MSDGPALFGVGAQHGLFGPPGERDQVAQPDLLGQPVDPATRYADRAVRKAAFDAWRAGGGGIDDLPAGLLSAIAGAALRLGRKR